MKNVNLGLLPRLVIGIIAGILIGLYLPEWTGRTLYTFTHLFGQFLVFMVPLIIVGFIAAGIAELGAKAGKLLAGTAGLAYGSTVLAGVLAYFVSTGIIPMFITHGDVGEGASGLTPFLEISTPPIFGVMTALVTAFVFGLGINYLKQKENRTTLFAWIDEFRSIIVLVIVKVIIPFLPIHIAGIFADMAASGEAFQTLAVFARVFAVIIGTHFLWILTQYTIAALRTGTNPFRAIRGMLPAYTTALGTMSSAATIPVTLQSVKSIGVSERTAEFVVPLSATIHLAGSTITLVACSVAVLILNGITPEFGIFLQFILLLGVTMIAAPGVPGGAVVAAIGLMASVLGMTDAQLGLMFALYMAQDGFGTACNVTGDGAISLMVDSMDTTPEA